MYDFKQKKVVIFDLEYTSWEGSLKRNWQGENEFREIVQIGGIKIDTTTFEELDTFNELVRPLINSRLSRYFTELTGITQKDIDENGKYFGTSLESFHEWCEGYDAYSFGNDGLELAENCGIHRISFPFRPEMFLNARDIFTQSGIDASTYSSGTINKALGIESNEKEHTALGDARNIVNSLRKLYTGKIN